jgi:hypothetical protein
MNYGDVVKPTSTDYLEHGLLTRILKMRNIGDTTNSLEPYGVSPMHGKLMIGKNVGTIMGFEGGTGISVGNATQYYGQRGYMPRRKLRIDKCPWPNGQEDIRLRITVTFGHTVGLNGAAAPNVVYIRRWRRNEDFYNQVFASGTAPATPFMESLGFSAGSGTIRVALEPRGVGPGQPFVWADENGLSESFIRCFWDNPTFSQGYSFINATDVFGNPITVLSAVLPCPIFVKHRLNFSNGFTATLYLPGQPLGIIEGVGCTIEAVGWDTGWHDLEGWHKGEEGDYYATPQPNSYEYPNYPISDPFNPTGDGVG